ncbi:Panacea domain-containing protein [Sphingobium lactosutens]|uniref:Antitoxin SocA-like Panacea domain-containing protein n=1 Tax=Sphingobium lactosutens DS20 TaxID=1331060 RepID=T0HJV5_9SPHN|nr:type II toxin-antitoxin system antitoxin SocA domain-containing protein [Sphingobium lactosutens]EQB12448.1 hypothetical protein RLDS_20150 [Sphingobium lactosutens DS20]
MALSIMQVAKTIGDLSGWSRSNLEMQKIAYIAEMIYLGRKGAPLIRGNFQAWDNGPVHPELYHWAKMYGSEPISKRAFLHVAPVPAGTDEHDAILSAYKAMKDFSPWEMVDLTHQTDGAWAKHYVPRQRGTVIPRSSIKEEYGIRITEND